MEGSFVKKWGDEKLFFTKRLDKNIFANINVFLMCTLFYSFLWNVMSEKLSLNKKIHVPEFLDMLELEKNFANQIFCTLTLVEAWFKVSKLWTWRIMWNIIDTFSGLTPERISTLNLLNKIKNGSVNLYEIEEFKEFFKWLSKKEFTTLMTNLCNMNSVVNFQDKSIKINGWNNLSVNGLKEIVEHDGKLWFEVLKNDQFKDISRKVSEFSNVFSEFY